MRLSGRTEVESAGEVPCRLPLTATHVPRLHTHVPSPREEEERLTLIRVFSLQTHGFQHVYQGKEACHGQCVYGGAKQSWSPHGGGDETRREVQLVPPKPFRREATLFVSRGPLTSGLIMSFLKAASHGLLARVLQGFWKTGDGRKWQVVSPPYLGF